MVISKSFTKVVVILSNARCFGNFVAVLADVILLCAEQVLVKRILKK